MKNFLKLIVCIIICEIAGFIGSIFTTPAIKTWYAFLNKPSFSPPDWLFAPVWIILFALMGVALFLILKRGKVSFFVFQLIFNIGWSIIFFGLKSPNLAFIEIVILWWAILLTIINFYKTSKPAAFLLIPYILWVSFASVLNFFIWRLN